MEAEKNAAMSGMKLEAACSSVPECAWATAGSPSNPANTNNAWNHADQLLSVVFSEYSDQGLFENHAKLVHSLLHESHGPGSAGDAPRI